MTNATKRSLNIPVSERRRRRQKGVEALEFGLFAIMMAPALIWMFTNGMNFLRFNKANDVTRAASLMYIKNTDMTVLGTQEIIRHVAEGLDLQVDDGAAPPSQVLSSTRGSGLIILSQVQRVGNNTCPSGCTNLNQYVFMHRVYIGNKTLHFDEENTVQSALGNPSNASWNSTTGVVSNPHGDPGAQVSGSFANIWGSNGTQPPGDGQIIYVVECYFAGSFGSGPYTGRGIYSRVIM